VPGTLGAIPQKTVRDAVCQLILCETVVDVDVDVDVEPAADADDTPMTSAATAAAAITRCEIPVAMGGTL
jgi:hypothetical protein